MHGPRNERGHGFLSRSDNSEQTETLVSWKEIAFFLNHAERTVKRWERERGLPVHRVPGGERGGVFAYPSELNAWILGQQNKPAQSQAVIQENEPERNAVRPELENLPTLKQPQQVQVHVRSFLGSHLWLIGAAALVVVLGIAEAAKLVDQHTRGEANAGTSLGQSASGAPHVPSPRAEEFYLQGRYQWSLRTADSLAKSVDDYTQAIIEDPAYARSYAGLAESYDLLPEYGRIERSEGYSEAKAAAARAIQLDPNLAAGHRANGFAIFYGDWDVPGSDAEFRRALALDPNAVETHHWYATTLASRLERAQSLAEIDEALHLSPTNPAIVADAAFLHALFRNQRETAIKTLRELERTQPNLVKSSRYLEEFDLEDGNYPAYLVDTRQAGNISRNPDEIALANAAARGWARSGKEGLLEAIREEQQAAFERGTCSGNTLGKTYLLLRRPKEALKYFKAALDRNDFMVMTLSGCNCVNNLKDNPEYASLFRQVRERMHLSSATPLNMASAKLEARPLGKTEPR